MDDPARHLRNVSSGQAVDPPRASIRVFILDDHELVRRGLADLLGSERDIEIVGEAATVAQALRRIPAVRPDVAVLDARLPDGSGIDVCREISSNHPEVRCVILTSYDDEEALFAAVMAGAAGYLLKQIGGSSLVDGIREVAAGRSLLDPVTTEALLARLRNPPSPDLSDGLTARDVDRREQLETGGGRGCRHVAHAGQTRARHRQARLPRGRAAGHALRTATRPSCAARAPRRRRTSPGGTASPTTARSPRPRRTGPRAWPR